MSATSRAIRTSCANATCFAESVGLEAKANTFRQNSRSSWLDTSKPQYVAYSPTARRLSVNRAITSTGIAAKAGADSIVMHLREDRRHVKDEDIFLVRPTDDFKVELTKGLYEAGLKRSIRLAEVIT